ncbi:MAG: alpha/beta hydrolase [Ruminococcus sp.]|nr:alpha/beta hydrolase [Ruminococcus sp.]
MKKALKIVGRILLGFLILIAVFLLVMTIYNQIMLKKNKDLYETPLGQLVEVDGHNMSIYTEGEGDHTIVFMSGWGTSSPILDFKALYSRLSDDYKIVVIEKFGYGFSDIVDGERDMDTILRQDREALEKAGIEAPFVLCPHSFSGYEATLWAQKYPEEVEGIVGLDMCTVNCKDESTLISEHDSMKKILPIYKFFQYTGILRIFEMDQSGTLSDEEKQIFKELYCKKSLNDTVVREGNNELERAAVEELNSMPLPTVPMIMYMSADNKDDKFWESGMQAMVDASENGQLIKLDCGHYVHDFEYERISKDMKEFIGTLS